MRQVQQQRWPRLARKRNTQSSIAVMFYQPIVVETLCVFNSSANSLLNETDSKISLNTGESKEASCLYQRISVLVQRFNARFFADRRLRRLNIVPTII